MKTLLLASLGWLAAGATPAEELKRERLPADVDLVVHLDVEGLKTTEIWKRLLESAQGAEIQADLDLEDVRKRFGIDPLRDVRAVTLYKVEKEEDPTVVLFSTSVVIDEAVRRAQGEHGLVRLELGGIPVYRFGNAPETADFGYAYVHAGAGEERVVVLASNESSVLRAARVLRGQEPSHARAGTALVLAPARGSFLYVAARSLPHIEDTPASRVLELSQGIQIDLGEAGGLLRAHLGLTAASPQDAFDIGSLVNGMVSLARLAGSELGEVVELLSGLRTTTLGSQVQLDFEFEVARLLEILEDLNGGFGHDEGDEALDGPAIK